MAEDKTKRIRELIGTLRAAGRAYYQESREIMSNFEYDKLYDELVSLEKETGIVFANSPTQNVGYRGSQCASEGAPWKTDAFVK